MARSSHRLFGIPLLAFAAILPFGCSSHSEKDRAARPTGDHVVITREDIAKQAWRTAWDVLQHSGKLQLEEEADGSVRVLHRGVSSMVDNTPLLFIDGIRVGNLAVLKQLRASDLLEVRILSGLEASTATVGGTAAGVIEITTISR